MNKIEKVFFLLDQLLIVFLFILYGHDHDHGHIKVVDVRSIINHEIKLAASLNLSQQQRESRAHIFSLQLQELLDRQANSGVTPVLLAPAVLAGADDVTHEIYAGLYDRRKASQGQ